MEGVSAKSKREQLKNISSFFRKSPAAHLQTVSVNLSVLVDEVITEFIGQRPDLIATFEIENNIIVQGDYSLLRTFIEKLIQNSISMNFSSQHHSIVFGQAKENAGTYFMMNNELGNSAKVSFGSFNYLDKKDLGSELKDFERIITRHNGKFWGIGKKDVGSIFYFSIDA